MSRSGFIFAVTFFVVAGSLMYMATFERSSTQEGGGSGKDFATNSGDPSAGPDESRRKRTKSERGGSTRLSIPASLTSHLNESGLKQVDAIIARTRRDSRSELDNLARTHKLTPDQRRKVFPFIVAHHDQAHPALIVNGQVLPTISPGARLEDSISSLLNNAQQDSLAEDAANDDAWWEEVVGQLESDLDNAIDNGEMVAVVDNEPSNGLTISERPADGDGDASEHSGGNLFDLLGR